MAIQHYAAEKLATAVELARTDKIVIRHVWTEAIETQDRPDGIIKILTGITFPQPPQLYRLRSQLDQRSGAAPETVRSSTRNLAVHHGFSDAGDLASVAEEQEAGGEAWHSGWLGGLLGTYERLPITEMRPTRRE